MEVKWARSGWICLQLFFFLSCDKKNDEWTNRFDWQKSMCDKYTRIYYLYHKYFIRWIHNFTCIFECASNISFIVCFCFSNLLSWNSILLRNYFMSYLFCETILSTHNCFIHKSLLCFWHKGFENSLVHQIVFLGNKTHQFHISQLCFQSVIFLNKFLCDCF